MKLYGFLFILLVVNQTNAYRMPLPFGNGFPASSDWFRSKPIKGNIYDFFLSSTLLVSKSILVTEEPPKFEESKEQENSAEPIKAENLVKAMNEALDAIDKIQIYNTRPIMERLEDTLRKNVWSIKTFLSLTEAERKEIRRKLMKVH